ncbi:MAG: hypothetical protein NZ522_04680, partial [Chitinophagales bacterium]|nr:hypothetical protein [Chitinophagales bacterium]
EELLEYNRMHYAKFIFFYYNALYMNYAKIDMNRAIEALDSLEREMKKLRNAYYEQFILLNKSTLLFELNRFDEAIRMLARLYINDSYQKASDSFKLKINTAELIMQWESGDMGVFKKRLKQVRKTFEISLSKKENIYDKIFLDIIEEMSKEGWEKNHKLIKKAKQFISTLEKNEAEDTGLLNYARWLKSKFSII